MTGQERVYLNGAVLGMTKAEIAEMILELDISQFVEKTYQMRYVFFHRDSHGNNENMDFAPRLCFTRTAANDENQSLWNLREWGHLRLPEPTVREVRQVSR